MAINGERNRGKHMLRYREWTLKWTDPPVEHKVTDIRLFSGNEEKIMLEFKPVLVRPGDEVLVGDWDYYDSFMIYQQTTISSLRPSSKRYFR